MLSFRSPLARAFSIENVNQFRYRFIKFRRNRPVDFYAVVHRSCQKLVFNNWNQMLLSYFPDFKSYEIFAFRKNQGGATFFSYITKRYGVMGGIGNHQRCSRNRRDHAFASPIERQRTKPCFLQGIAIEFFLFILDFLLAHADIPAPMRAHPQQIHGKEQDCHDADDHQETRSDHEEQFRNGIGFERHHIDESVLLPAHHSPNNDADGEQFAHAFKEICLTACAEYTVPTVDQRYTIPIRLDPVEYDAGRVLQKRGSKPRHQQGHQHGNEWRTYFPDERVKE